MQSRCDNVDFRRDLIEEMVQEDDKCIHCPHIRGCLSQYVLHAELILVTQVNTLIMVRKVVLHDGSCTEHF